MDTYVGYARPLDGESRYRPRGGSFEGKYEGPIWRFVAERLPRTLAARTGALAAADEWSSGAYLLETVPTALYVLTLHAHDPEQATARAVNDTCDNDTIAAIVGAAVGALHGEEASRSAGATTCSAVPPRPTTARFSLCFLRPRTHSSEDGPDGSHHETGRRDIPDLPSATIDVLLDYDFLEFTFVRALPAHVRCSGLRQQRSTGADLGQERLDAL